MVSDKRHIKSGENFRDTLLVETGERECHIVLDADAQVHLTAFVVSGGEGQASLDLTINLSGPGAELDLAALFIGRDHGRADIRLTINHLAPNCTSRQLVKGIAIDSATGDFTGLIHVSPCAQKTDAVLQNRNLQLADTAHIFTRPQLEIYADDVKCAHGATIGQLDPEAIYYMRGRGISLDTARQMLLHGFINEIITHSNSTDLPPAITAFL